MASYEVPRSVSKAVKKATLKKKIKASAAKDAPMKESYIEEGKGLKPADTQSSPKKKATSTTPGKAASMSDMEEYKKQDRLLGNTFAKIKKFEKGKKRAFITSPNQSDRIKSSMKKYKEYGKRAGVKDLGKYDADFSIFQSDDEE